MKPHIKAIVDKAEELGLNLKGYKEYQRKINEKMVDFYDITFSADDGE